MVHPVKGSNGTNFGKTTIYALVNKNAKPLRAHHSLQSRRQSPQHLKVLEDGPGIGASRDAKVEDSRGQSELGFLLLPFVPLQEDSWPSRTEDSVDDAYGCKRRGPESVHERVEPEIS